MEGNHIWLPILTIIITTAVNGMLASSEIAMMNLNESRLKSRTAQGDKLSKRLLHMKQHPSEFLSTVQIGITLAGLLSGAFVTEGLSAPLISGLRNLGLQGHLLTLAITMVKFAVTLILTYVMLVFGELVPKRIAIVQPEKTAAKISGLIHWLSKITKPLVKLLSVSTNGILRLLGINPEQNDNAVTEEEILVMMQEGHSQGAIEESEIEFLSNVFEFTDLKAENAMTHRTEIQGIPSHASLKEITRLMSKTGFHKYPVFDGTIDKITGVIYSEDLIAYLSGQENTACMQASAADLMREPLFVPESQLLINLFRLMKQKKESLAVIVDEYGGTSGIITMIDIIEEIVGDLDLDDEIQEQEDGSLIVSGNTELEQVWDALHFPALPSAGPATLSGFLIERIGSIPTSENLPDILFQGYRFRILDRNGAVIQSVRIQKQEAP